MEEYKALRNEIILCLERRVTLLSYGLTAVGVLTAAGVAALTGPNNNEGAASVVFLIGVPLSAIFVLEIWFAETRRLRRASYYIYGLERSVNSLLPNGARGLRWEQGIRPNPADGRLRSSGHFADHYKTISMFFVSVAAIASIFGVHTLIQIVPTAKNISTEIQWLAAFTIGSFVWSSLAIRYLQYSDWLEANYNRTQDTDDLKPKPIRYRITMAWTGIAILAAGAYLALSFLHGA